MTDEVRDNWPGLIKKFLGFASSEVVDAINTLINDINTQLGITNVNVAALGGLQNLGGDLSGTLPNPTVAAGAVTSAKMASGAAATNVGTLSGVLTGTLPAPGLGSQVVNRVNIIKGKALPQWFDIQAYGAVGDNSTDDKAAINSAIAAANAAVNGVLYIPAATGYSISGTLNTITCPTVMGDGPNASNIYPTGSFPTMVITGAPAGSKIEGFSIVYTPTVTSGAGYALSVTNSGLTYDTSIRDIAIWYCYNGLNLSNIGAATFDSIKVLNYRSVGINHAMPAATDSGDSALLNCQLSAAASPSYAVFWVSGGGLRTLNNKMTGSSYGLFYQLANGVNTSQLQAQGNSFDTVSTACIALSRAGATGTLGEVIFSNNVMNFSHFGVYAPNDANGVWLSNVVTNGNLWSGDTAANSAYFVCDSTNNIMVADAALVSNVSSSQALNIGSGVTGGVVGPFAKRGTFAANTMSGASITSIAPV